MLPTEGNVLSLENVTLDLAGRRILNNVTLSVRAGGFLGIIGPNGGGKTTLLRVMLGLLAPTAGRIVWSVAPSVGAPRVGYVPRRCAFDRNYPLSGREIVKQGLSGAWPRFGQKGKQADEQADCLLERVGLGSDGSTPFVVLSGGQQRRLLLARALINHPSILLLDEPTAGVDTEGQDQFYAILRELCNQGITIVLVSHDIPLVTEHADCIACLCVDLHWHGEAKALDHKVITSTYRCELERYQTHRDKHFHPPSNLTVL